MIRMLFTLQEQKPVPCSSVLEWTSWLMNAENRRVKETLVGETWVSTVFLGVSYHAAVSAMFETMVFGGPLDGTVRRSHTWDQAETVHADICAQVLTTQEIHILKHTD